MAHTFRTELEVVTDLLADMERKLRKTIHQLESTAHTMGPGRGRRVRVQIDLLESQIEWYAKILATYAEAERIANEYEPGTSNRLSDL
jgi:hypothetical protein